MTQRRCSSRRPLRLAVSLGGKLPATTVDVSAEGFRIELPQVFIPGAKVHGHLLDGKRKVPFAGEVAWAIPGNPQLSLCSRIGVRFCAMSAELRALLAPES